MRVRVQVGRSDGRKEPADEVCGGPGVDAQAVGRQERSTDRATRAGCYWAATHGHTRTASFSIAPDGAREDATCPLCCRSSRRGAASGGSSASAAREPMRGIVHALSLPEALPTTLILELTISLPLLYPERSMVLPVRKGLSATRAKVGPRVRSFPYRGVLGWVSPGRLHWAMRHAQGKRRQARRPATLLLVPTGVQRAVSASSESSTTTAPSRRSRHCALHSPPTRSRRRACAARPEG